MLLARCVFAERGREKKRPWQKLPSPRISPCCFALAASMEQTGSARSAARARAGTEAWQRRGAACYCCARGALATAEAACS
eukprot:5371349-Pleurochrysis_carterae.AAC.1